MTDANNTFSNGQGNYNQPGAIGNQPAPNRMVQCPYCGQAMYAEAAICPHCGRGNAARNSGNYRAPDYNTSSSPAYSQNPQTYGSPYSSVPMAGVGMKKKTLGTYLGWIALALLPNIIPVVGIVVPIIFAFSGTDEDRKNFFRAALLVHVILFVLSALSVLIFSTLFSGVIYSLWDELEYLF